MDVQRGKKLEYLGLTLDYETKGVCKVGASSYIDKALQNYREPVKVRLAHQLLRTCL